VSRFGFLSPSHGPRPPSPLHDRGGKEAPLSYRRLKGGEGGGGGLNPSTKGRKNPERVCERILTFHRDGEGGKGETWRQKKKQKFFGKKKKEEGGKTHPLA